MQIFQLVQPLLPFQTDQSQKSGQKEASHQAQFEEESVSLLNYREALLH